MSLYSEVNKKMKKRNDMGVWVYGCMPCSGGGEKKCTHTRKRMFLVWAQWGCLRDCHLFNSLRSASPFTVNRYFCRGWRGDWSSHSTFNGINRVYSCVSLVLLQNSFTRSFFFIVFIKQIIHFIYCQLTLDVLTGQFKKIVRHLQTIYCLQSNSSLPIASLLLLPRLTLADILVKVYIQFLFFHSAYKVTKIFANCLHFI